MIIPVFFRNALHISFLHFFTGQWVPCAKSTTPEAEVTGLQEGKKYKFRVKAVNKEGDSEPLENDELILAKNPYGECLGGSVTHDLILYQIEHFRFFYAINAIEQQATHETVL